MENLKDHESFVLLKFSFLCPILKNRKAVEGGREGGNALNAAEVGGGFQSLQRMSLTYMCYILSYPERRHLRWERHVVSSQWRILPLVNVFWEASWRGQLPTTSLGHMRPRHCREIEVKVYEYIKIFTVSYCLYLTHVQRNLLFR